MRVLHVYSGNLYGGVERMLSAMASSGRFDEHEYALCFEGRLSAELREAGARVHHLPAARLRSPLSVLRFRRALAGKLAQRFERIVCHGVWSYCVAGRLRRGSGSRPVLFLHDVPEPSKLLYRWAWRHPPACCIANSEFVKERVLALGGRVETRVVHPLVPSAPAVSGEAARALRRSYGAADDDVVILQASRLDSWKGHRTLLRALAKLVDMPRWQAWIAGSPQRPEEQRYAAELVALARTLGISDRLRFIGHRSDMPVVLSACDIYCQPNELPEPFGMVFVEALGLGKPVVAGDRGGVREIVSDDCGVLCASDAGAVATALASLIQDAALRAQLGEAATKRAANRFGLDAYARALEAALR